MKRLFCAIITLWFLAAAEAGAAEPEPREDPAFVLQMQTLVKSLKPQQGDIQLPGAMAKLTLGDKYYFLAAPDAKRLLTEAWGNPPSATDDVLGMVVPKDGALIDGWGAVLRYEETFYVEDRPAKPGEYDKLMEEMKAAQADENRERKKQGFGQITVVGWAEPPKYNAAHHDLIWAKDLLFDGQDVHTLNYDVRHLGRQGLLSINFVSEVDNLPQIRAVAADLALRSEFLPGWRYSDHIPTDKRAAFGLVGVVAAGVGLAAAQKAGLLAAGLILLKKGAVLIVAAGTAAAAWVRRLFSRRR